ncbi:hypothetical protein B0H10DRAFT_2227102 [Mycena sp. CBHHK59/15]|nr:hypothetical protein B0H10DRAFT_2227102 [Mycena sp. CBHHK59/15]
MLARRSPDGRKPAGKRLYGVVATLVRSASPLQVKSGLLGQGSPRRLNRVLEQGKTYPWNWFIFAPALLPDPPSKTPPKMLSEDARMTGSGSDRSFKGSEVEERVVFVFSNVLQCAVPVSPAVSRCRVSGSLPLQDRYRFWAAPFRDRLISYDAPVPGLPPPGPSPPGAPPPPPPSASMAHKRAADDSTDSERAKKRQELLNDPLLIQIPPPSDERVPPPNTEPDTLLADVEQSAVPPPNTEPDMLLPDVEQSTVPPPNTEPNTSLVNVEQSTDVVPDAGGADGAPPVQPDMLYVSFSTASVGS